MLTGHSSPGEAYARPIELVGLEVSPVIGLRELGGFQVFDVPL